MRILIFVSTFFAAAACASTSTTGHRDHCALAAGDSVYLQAGPVYRDCAVERRAVLTNRSQHADYRPSSPLAPGTKACYVAEVEFVVDTTGRPEEDTPRVVRTNNPDFAVAAVSAMKRWRYTPATIQGVPVRQIVREKEEMVEEVVVVPMGGVPRPSRPQSC